MIRVESGQVQLEGNHSVLMSDLTNAMEAVKDEMMKEVDERIANIRLETSYMLARGYRNRQEWLKVKEKHHIG